MRYVPLYVVLIFIFAGCETGSEQNQILNKENNERILRFDSLLENIEQFELDKFFVEVEILRYDHMNTYYYFTIDSLDLKNALGLIYDYDYEIYNRKSVIILKSQLNSFILAMVLAQNRIDKFEMLSDLKQFNNMPPGFSISIHMLSNHGSVILFSDTVCGYDNMKEYLNILNKVMIKGDLKVEEFLNSLLSYMEATKSSASARL